MDKITPQTIRAGQNDAEIDAILRKTEYLSGAGWAIGDDGDCDAKLRCAAKARLDVLEFGEAEK